MIILLISLGINWENQMTAISRTFAIFVLIGLFGLSAYANIRSEIDRFKVITDKVKIEELHRPFKHKFFLDLNVRESRGLRDVIDDGKDVSNSDAATVTRFINSHLDTEHFGMLNFKGGVPFPQFSVGEMDFMPSALGVYELAASLSVSQLSAPVVVGPFTVAPNNPFIQLYLKKESRYGGKMAWSHSSDFSGYVYLYYMGRWDRLEAVTASDIINNKKVLKLDKPKNTVQSINADIMLKYDYGETQFYGAVEDVEIHEISDKRATNGRLFYGSSPVLMKFWAERKFNFYNTWFKTYLGAHKRSGYTWGRGIFGGSTINYREFPVSLLLNFDSEYATVNPRFRWKVFQLEYVSKIPIQTMTDGNVRTALLHAVNLRISI